MNNTTLELLNLLTSTLSIYQAKHLHNKELSLSSAHHNALLELSLKYHKLSLLESKRLYLLEILNNIEQHFQQLNSDLISSTKECELDMFNQRNQRFQTIILAASVMFGALSTAIVDGNLPLETWKCLIILFSITSTLSFAFLFLSIVLSIEVIIRATSFMYIRSNIQAKQIEKAIAMTSNIIYTLRSSIQDSYKEEISGVDVDKGLEKDREKEELFERRRKKKEEDKEEEIEGIDSGKERKKEDSNLEISNIEINKCEKNNKKKKFSSIFHSSTNSSLSTSLSTSSSNSTSSSLPYPYKISHLNSESSLNTSLSTSSTIYPSPTYKHSKLSRQSSSPTPSSANSSEDIYNIKTDINFTTLSSENIVKYFDKHEEHVKYYMKDRNNLIKKIGRINQKQNFNINFPTFWNMNCKLWGEYSLYSFYIGTTCLVLSILIYMFCFFYFEYESLTSSLLSIIILLCGLFIVLFGILVLRKSGKPTVLINYKLNKEMHKREMLQSLRKMGNEFFV